ncbi:MAG TPA: hypothetical protein VF231_05690 [Candidatus Limnocylindrales bacterium]
MDVLRTLAATAVLTAILVAGCGGAPSAENEPAGVVTSAFDAVESGGVERLAEFSCAAQAGDLLSVLGGDASALAGLEALGLDPQALLDSMKLDFQDVTATETSRSGSEATVHVAGSAAVSFDETKLREILKQVIEGQGQTANDAVLDQALAMMSGQLNQTQAIDADVRVVQENGKWLICSA